MQSNLRENVGVPASAARVALRSGVELAVAREGEGPPLVCLHATGHGGGDFAELARALAGEYEVIRIDWPGQGRSPSEQVPASAARYGELLIELLDQLGIERPILLGNSIGGAAALHYASARPVHALVLCNPAGLLRVDALTRMVCWLAARFFEASGARWFMPLFALYYRRLVLPRAYAREQRERIIAAGHELAPVLREAWRSFGQPDADLRVLASTIQAPVWLAWARNDRVIPLWMCRAAIARIPHATLSTFDAGHAAFLEDPRAFLDGLRAFLRLNPSAGSSRRSSA